MSQHDSNYSTTHIISMGSKLFPSVKYTFHSIYSNTSPSTKQKLHNNLFKHTLGEFMSTYPFYSSMAISTCPKCYVTTQFKLFNYTYYFNGIKNYFLQSIYFSLNIFDHQSYPLNKSYIIIYLIHFWWVYVHIPILLLHGHFPLSKI